MKLINLILSLFVLSNTLFAQDTISMNNLTLTFENRNPIWLVSDTQEKITGFAVDYYGNNTISLLGYFESGVGIYEKSFHKNGVLSSIVNYDIEGKITNFYGWDTSGIIKKDGYYLEGELTGNWKFYKNGKLVETGEYLESKMVGVWKYFDLNGILIKNVHYENDHLLKVEEF